MNDQQQPSHSDLDRKLDQAIALAKAAEERAEEAVSIANDNKTRLDEIAGATKLGKWLLPIVLTVGAFGVAIAQLWPNGK